ncbi:hypothetical protein J2T57_002586 [Natronocella acetinitrilica]|uniref:Uncharacterized protein n=1 Tax=Natronocella acetinitrilica TaxID=414046 RepID=A0AAE3G451_9GAMM|nr:hypothetical protein [Natronocella acetinitrilica]
MKIEGQIHWKLKVETGADVRRIFAIAVAKFVLVVASTGLLP